MSASEGSAKVAAGSRGGAATGPPLIAFVYLAVTGLSWAGSWPPMKLALGAAPPLSMMPAAIAGQVLTLTPIGGFVLSLMIFGGTLTLDVVVAIALIIIGIFVTLQR